MAFRVVRMARIKHTIFMWVEIQSVLGVYFIIAAYTETNRLKCYADRFYCNKTQIQHSQPTNIHKYMHTYTCKQTDRKRVKETRIRTSIGAHAQYFSSIAYILIHIFRFVFSIHFSILYHLYAYRLVSVLLCRVLVYGRLCMCMYTRVSSYIITFRSLLSALTEIHPIAHSLSYCFCSLHWVLSISFFPDSFGLLSFHSMFRNIQVYRMQANVKKRDRTNNVQRQQNCQNSFVYVCLCVFF